MKRLALLLVLGAGFALAAPGFAERMQLVPGEWEFRNTSAVPLALPALPPMHRRCVREAEVDPQSLLSEAPTCTLSDVASTALTLHWRMACQLPSGRVTGVGQALSTGRSVRGTMRVAMQLGGRPLELEQRFEGRRLGPCR